MSENPDPPYKMVPLVRDIKPVEVKPPDILLTPRGEIILGQTDPRTLSREEFNQSPHILFHGARSDFDFDPNRDPFEDGPRSAVMTVGYGFYATDNRDEAIIFSRARLYDSGEEMEPVVKPVLPYQARMFDFRSIEEEGNNGLVPVEMIREFSSYYKNWLEGLESKPDLNHTLLQQYNLTLDQIVALNSPFELRDMLSSEARGDRVDAVASGVFTRYMLSKAFDGIIYIEAGDDPRHQNPTSFVFYNPAKVGTYESWHNLPETSK